MIKGIGIDLAELDRIKELWDRYGMKFAHRILTDREVEQLPKTNPIKRLAALFAGKEAAVKALGTGFSQGIHFKCIEILHAPSGKPEITFLGNGHKECKRQGITVAHISLTHSRDTAGATVILEG